VGVVQARAGRLAGPAVWLPAAKRRVKRAPSGSELRAKACSTTSRMTAAPLRPCPLSQSRADGATRRVHRCKACSNKDVNDAMRSLISRRQRRQCASETKQIDAARRKPAQAGRGLSSKLQRGCLSPKLHTRRLHARLPSTSTGRRSCRCPGGWWASCRQATPWPSSCRRAGSAAAPT